MTYVDLRPSDVRPVEVLVDGTWRGYVRWTTGRLTETHLGWFTDEQLRAR